MDALCAFVTFGAGNYGLRVAFVTLKAFERIEMGFVNVGDLLAFDF